MELSQNYYNKLRDYAANLPDDRRKIFVDKYKSLDDDKKTQVLTRLFGEEELREPLRPDVPRFIEQQDLVEQRIANRASPMETLRREIATPYDFIRHPIKSTLKPLVTGMKAINVPVESALSGISAAGLGVQRGEPIPEVLRMAGRGITNKYPAQLSDIGVGAGIPSPISEAVGFFGSLGITNLATKGKLVDAAKRIESVVVSKLPKIMSKTYVLDRAKKAVSGLDELGEALDDSFDDIYNKIGDNPIKKEIFNNDFWKDIPEQAIRKIRQITKTKQGQELPNNINTLKDVKRAIWKSLSRQDIVKETPEYWKIKNAYWKVSKAITESAGEYAKDLSSLNTKAKDFYKMRDSLYKILYDSEGNIVANKLKNLATESGEPAYKEIFKKFEGALPKAMNIMKDVEKFNRRQYIKSLGSKAAVGGLGIYESHKMIDKLFNRQ